MDRWLTRWKMTPGLVAVSGQACLLKKVSGDQDG